LLYKAVITGDIVNSREVEDMQALLQVLKNIPKEIEKALNTSIKLEVYRGDSFQMLIEHPEEAMKVAILTRCKLRSKTPYSDTDDQNIPLDALWDARISVGIGQVNTAAERIVESTGEAFEISGNQLDEIKKTKDRLRFCTNWKDLNHQFETLAKLSDAIISRWTLSSSEATYRRLLFGETQKEIAQKLEISQPAVHKRLNIANVDAIENMLNYLNLTIKKQLNGI
jgi:hypothetical protein